MPHFAWPVVPIPERRRFAPFDQPDSEHSCRWSNRRWFVQFDLLARCCSFGLVGEDAEHVEDHMR